MGVNKLHIPYRGYTVDTPPDEIRRQFRERFGEEPKEIFQSGPIVLAGPIPDVDGEGGRAPPRSR